MSQGNPGSNFSIDEQIKALIKDVVSTIVHFLKNPIEGIKKLPDWDWKTLLVLQVVVSLLSGVLSGIVSLSVFAFLAGLILVPIVSVVTAIISSLFLYYTFMLLANRQIPPRPLFTLVIMANIPFFIFQTLSPLVPPISIIGFLFTAFLMIVGLVHNFAIERKLVVRVISTLFIVYLLIWLWGRVDAYLLSKSAF